MTTLAPETYAKSLDCVHCGLCLDACPTYRATGRETSSPRGRIYLMRGVAEGRAALADLLQEEAFLCLGCRACETACPSGVQYGSLLEDTRTALVDQGLRRSPAARLERALLKHLVPHPRRLRLALSGLALAQRLQLDRLAARVLPARLARLLSAAPRVPPAAERVALPEWLPAEGTSRGVVAVFAGCVMPELFGAVNAATVRVLVRNGYDVWVPRSQGCCGALQAHAGDRETAHQLAAHNVRAFEDRALDAVIVNSAGCGAALREVTHWLGADAQAFADRVRDVCEFLDERGLRAPSQRVAARVCYDDPCHLVHAQRVRDAPRRLLAQIDGLELISHGDAAACCGAAGTYNLTQPEMAGAVLDRKLNALAEADPDWVATGNPGCLMHIAGGLRRRGLRARVVHPIELLDWAYGGDPGGAAGGSPFFSGAAKRP
ncbi:MAG: 4Fe-4S dicluster domain-containing protein [Proteobacteria bacterium]|nr:4Fe-4S dicluster domain-containing protein [Pseudomonadota bacterium]